ncbi:MAG: acyl-CoA thioesterase [Oceanospirillales bacterium]|uniref:Acyl-CoA thioester hydrolase n=1 Tax=Marinobacterium halophilum TaxID=267374 RepID=A0A2P8F4J6_9GAMM|nr:acyl-CoA thioesterase [Marinobacterium halophilum]MBR9828050.1 acyl-CoA thioesterase [Oceanospirillales bacterium]PSL16641.1 acyl-CoA thioester hydrolase [Marinobacterium halophilum]
MVKTAVELDIPFHDVDIMRIAWHGHYAKYLEIARCALLEQIDYNVPQMEASGYAWPVIDMRIRYAQPLHFQQKIRVEASLTEWEHRLKIDYMIKDAVSGKRLTKAYTVQVAVAIESGEMLYASPAVLLQKLGLEP